MNKREQTREEKRLRKAILAKRRAHFDRLVVLDDDPTGAQSIHSVPVLTTWSEADLTAEVERGGECFFLMTNSRAMPPEKARETALTIGTRLRHLADRYRLRLLVISRGDSTLRGHYPNEVNALAEGLGYGNDYLQLIAPAFFAGGRVTQNGTHYVREGDHLIPVNETAYARDHSFAYHHAYLPDWVTEKCKGATHGILLHWNRSWLRRGDATMLSSQLSCLPRPLTLSVDATRFSDLQRVAFALVASPGRKVLPRTAADFVKAVLAQEPRPLLKGEECPPQRTGTGGLVVVGSHVPKTTRQLSRVREENLGDFIEADVKILSEVHATKLPALLADLTDRIDERLSRGATVIFHTSRTPLRRTTEAESLELAVSISTMLCTVVRQLSVVPRFLIAKGGITSSDVATRALGTRRAWVVGQLLPGVPVWRLDVAERFEGLHLVVFPGNVGTDDGLAKAIRKLQ